MRFLLIAGLLGWMSVSFAQSPDTLWTRTYGGPQMEKCLSAATTSDEGFLLAGYTESFGSGGTDAWILRTDSLGDSLWSRTFGGSGDDEIRVIVKMSNELYILAGETTTELSRHIWTMAIDEDGDSLWSRAFDRSYLVDAVGTEEDEVVILSLGMSLLIVNSTGDSVGSYDVETDGFTTFVSMDYDSGRGFILGGYSYEFEHDVFEQPVLAKISSGGEFEWSTENTWPVIWNAVTFSNDGSVLAAGDNSGYDHGMARFNATGSPLWWQETDIPVRYSTIREVADGNILTAGSVWSDGWLRKTTRDGDLLWEYRYSFEDGYARFSSLICLGDAGFLLSGYAGRSGLDDADFLLVRLAPDTASSSPHASLLSPLQSLLMPCYPNPFNPTTTITFSLPRAQQASIAVCDLTGRLVTTLADEVMGAGEHAVEFDGTGLPSGIYFARLEAGSQAMTRKMVLLK